jgi:flagellar assembly protein FliH
MPRPARHSATPGAPSSTVRRWQPASFGGLPPGALSDIEALRQRAQAEGHDAGFRAGAAAAEALAQRLRALVGSTQHAVSLMEERLAGELLDLALEVARQVVRGELHTRRDAVMAVTREALGLLAQDARGVQLVSHPRDAEFLRQQLGVEIARGDWELVEDARIEPGGVRIFSTAGDVDATLGTRWRRALAAFGQDHPWASEDDADAAGDDSGKGRP